MSIILKSILNKWDVRIWTGSRWGRITDSCKLGNELSSSTEAMNFLISWVAISFWILVDSSSSLVTSSKRKWSFIILEGNEDNKTAFKQTESHTQLEKKTKITGRIWLCSFKIEVVEREFILWISGGFQDQNNVTGTWFYYTIWTTNPMGYFSSMLFTIGR
jgi:hypothetical protein